MRHEEASARTSGRQEETRAEIREQDTTRVKASYMYTTKVVLATSMSSVLAWYSWGLYCMAVEMGTAFKSPNPLNPSRVTLMLPFGLAGRVVGAFIFGQIGDTFSRRAGLVPSLMIVGVFTCIMGFIPVDTLIVKRPALWATLRFIQGIGVGGQWPGTTLLAFERAGSNKWQQSIAGSTAQAGVASGLGCAAYVFYGMVTTGRWYSWTWKMAFGIPIILVPLALYIWKAVGLTPDEPPVTGGRLPCVELMRVHKGTISMAVLYLGIEALGLTVLLSGWWILFPISERRLVIQALRYCLLGLFVTATVGLVFGSIVGRIRVRTKYLWSAPLLGVAICLWFGLLNSADNPVSFLYTSPTILGPALGLIEGCVGALMASEFDRSIRYSGMGIVYHLCHLIVETAFPMAMRHMASSNNASRDGAHVESGVSVLIVVSSIMLTSLISAVAVRASAWTSTLSCLPSSSLKVRHGVAMAAVERAHSDEVGLSKAVMCRRDLEGTSSR